MIAPTVRVVRAQAEEGVRLLGLPPHVLRGFDVFHEWRWSRSLITDAIASPENVAQHLPGVSALPPHLVARLRSLRVVVLAQGELQNADPSLVVGPGHDAFFDAEDATIAIACGEEASRSVSWLLLHEVGHTLYETMPDAWLAQWEEAPPASPYPPAVQDAEENFAEALAAFYTGTQMPQRTARLFAVAADRFARGVVNPAVR